MHPEETPAWQGLDLHSGDQFHGGCESEERFTFVSVLYCVWPVCLSLAEERDIKRKGSLDPHENSRTKPCKALLPVPRVCMAFH